MNLAPPTEEARVAEVQGGAVAPWLGAAASTGALVGFLVGEFEGGRWVPMGSIWSRGAGRPEFPSDAALMAAAAAAPGWLGVRFVAWFVLVRRPATTATRDLTICLASAFALGASVAIVATGSCVALALDWSGAPADPRMVASTLFLGVSCIALGTRALLLGSVRSSSWVIELDLLVLAIAGSLAGFWCVFTALSNMG